MTFELKTLKEYTFLRTDQEIKWQKFCASGCTILPNLEEINFFTLYLDLWFYDLDLLTYKSVKKIVYDWCKFLFLFLLPLPRYTVLYIYGRLVASSNPAGDKLDSLAS